jgi:hypothetical protein
MLPGEVLKVGLPLFGVNGRLEPLLNMLVSCGVAAEKIIFVGTNEKWAAESGEKLYPNKFMFRLGVAQEKSLSGEKKGSDFVYTREKGIPATGWRSETHMNFLTDHLLVWDEIASSSHEDSLRRTLEGVSMEDIVITGETKANISSIQATLAKCTRPVGTRSRRKSSAGSSALDLTMDADLLAKDPEKNFEDVFTSRGADALAAVVVAFDCSNVESQTLEPTKRLHECINGGDALVVKLAAILDSSFTAELKVDDNLPDFKGFNLYSEKAYGHADKIRKFRKCGKDRLKRFLPPLGKAELEASKSMRYKVFTDDDSDLVAPKGETKQEKDHADADALHRERQLLGFRASMADSFDNASGMNSEDDQADLLQTVVDHECSKMQFKFVEADGCKEIFKKHLNLLSKAFRFYCGVSGGDGGGQGLGSGTASMNHAEFVAFISRCKLMPKVEDTNYGEQKEMVDAVFVQSDSGLGEECGDVEHEVMLIVISYA